MIMANWWVIAGIFTLTALAACAIGFLADFLSTPPELRKKTAPAELRTALHQAGPPSPGVCPICGMDDPDHLEARWRTHPAHADCLEWLMPNRPSLVDEYANPALSDSAGRRPAYALGGVTTAEACAALSAMFTINELREIEVTTPGDPEPVYLPGGIATPPLPPLHIDPKLITGMY